MSFGISRARVPRLTNFFGRFPPVFHEWFLETFPEPTVWLSSRLAYNRTAAVMSMIGFILGSVLPPRSHGWFSDSGLLGWVIDIVRTFF